jgi:hypothetical protein
MKFLLASAILLILTSGQADAAPFIAMKKGYPYARGIGECVRLANARGWVRRGESGRFKFIIDCRLGKQN